MSRILIFATRAEYDAFEAKMAAALGLPKPGRNGRGEIIDPERKTGIGWTTRATHPVEHPDGRVMTVIDDADEARLSTAERQRLATKAVRDVFRADIRAAKLERAERDRIKGQRE